jgi:hypothetical protein
MGGMPPFVRRALPIAALLAAGLVVVAVGGRHFVVFLTGSVLIGLAGILIVALIFYEIGLSEDRAREAERRGG